MRVSIIVAVSENGVIGREGQLPWHLPVDLKHFKSLTWGHHLIMGRKTFESLANPLPGRVTIVLTRQSGYRPEGCLVASSLEQALETAAQQGEVEVFIAGGAAVYAAALEHADRIYLTRLHAHIAGDVYFPPFDETRWTETWSEDRPADERNPYPLTFKILERKE